MPTIRDPDDNWQILNARQNNNVVTKMFGDVTKASAGKQIAIGGATGWCAGYISGKISKAAAVAVGGSLLLLQIASHQGYIQVDWTKMKKEIKKAKKEISKNVSKTNVESIIDEVQDFVRENVFLAGGFAGGFLIGLAS